MSYILIAEASCDGALLESSRDFRVTLNSSLEMNGRKKKIKSNYISYERGHGGDQLLWMKPFGDKIRFATLPPHLSVTLHRRGRFQHGPDVAKYVLDCSSDCNARPFVLLPTGQDPDSKPPMRLLVTVFGNPPNAQQDSQTVLSVEPGSSLQPKQSSNAAAPTTSHEHLDVQTKAEISVMEASAGVAKVNPKLAQRLDQVSDNRIGVATEAAGGLASTLSNLEGIVKIADLLADIHPLVKGAWSLVSAAYQVARAQAILDESIKTLIDAMDDGTTLAKNYTPLTGRHLDSDSIVRDILLEVIKAARLVKLYCKKRPSNLSAIKTLASNLAQDVDECSTKLSTLKQNLLAQSVIQIANTVFQSHIRIEHINDIMDQNAANDTLKEIRYADEANRALRDGSPGCLNGTRIEVRGAVEGWNTGISPPTDLAAYLNVLDPEKYVLWLCGVAGAGKSSIAISLAKALREQGVLGSMYSFQTAKQATLNPTNLFSTIARHLAMHDPLLKERLVEIIRQCDPIARDTLSPTDQFEKFLLPLFSHDNVQTAVEPTVIIIDAFDECGDLGARRDVLNILTQRANELPPGVRLIITSRYEEDVQRALNSQTHNVCLLKMEQIPEASTRGDIYLYVHNSLKDVDGLDSPDYVSDLTKLALAAEQSFQWASTACLYIKNEDDGDAAKSPRMRLNEVLQSKEGLDPLYCLILDRHFGSSHRDNLQLLRTILGCLVCAKEPLSLRSIVALSTDVTTGAGRPFDSKDYHRLARKLSSLITGTENLETPLIALHTSFTDFLGSEARSHEKYFIDVDFNQHLAAGCLHIMDTDLRFDICGASTSFQRNEEIEGIQERIQEKISEALSYACRFWPYHVSRLTEWTESDALREPVTDLLSRRFLEWLEVMSWTGSSALEVLEPLATSDKMPPKYHHLSNLVAETNQFASYFAVPIARSAPHIYLSALPFIPTSSPLHDLLGRYKKTAKVTSGGLVGWPNIRHILEGHADDVNSVAYSADGRLIASGSDDMTIHLWDATQGREIGVLKGHSGIVRSVAFSPDGALIASASYDKTIRIWDVGSHTAVGHPLEGHSRYVRSVAFSPNGLLIASGSDDKTIRIWDVGSHTAVGHPLEGHSGYVLSVAFSPNGALIASASDDKTIRIWDVGSRTAVGHPLEGHSGAVLSVAFSPDGALIASGSSDETIRIWDVGSRTAVGHPLEGHSGYVLSVAFSPDGALIASGSGDNTICIWDVGSRTAVGHPLEGHSGIVLSVAFSPDGALIASGSGDNTICIWNVGSRTAVLVGHPVEGHSGIVQSVVFSPDGALIASGSDDNTIRIWDVGSRTAVGHPLEGHSNYVRSVTFSPDGALLASGSDDKTIRIWDVGSRTAVGHPLEGHSNYVRSVTFSPDGALLASGSNDETIRIWYVGSRTAVGHSLEGHSDNVRSVTFSPDGALLASGSDDKTIRIWDVGSRTAAGNPLEGHSGVVHSVAFSPDSALIASGSKDGSIRTRGSYTPILTDGRSAADADATVSPPNRVPFHPSMQKSPTDFGLYFNRKHRLEDGWIVGPGNELVLWIPPSLRDRLGDLRMLGVLGDPDHRVMLDFSQMAWGPEWAECFTGDSAYSNVSVLH